MSVNPVPHAPATDEEVAKMVERLLHDCSRIGEPHDHMIMAQAADLLARVARERDEARDWLRLRAHDIVELGQQLAAAEQRAEAAEKVLAALLPDKELGDVGLFTYGPFAVEAVAPSSAVKAARAHLAKHAGGNNG